MLLKRIKIAERIDSIEPREAKEKIFQAASGISSCESDAVGRRASKM
jgi:hypothetical protein